MYIDENTKALIFDIETSLMMTTNFSLFGNDYMHHDSIVQDWYVICCAWKWMGEDSVHTVSVSDNKRQFKKDPTNDEKVIKKMHQILTDADIVIGHNIDKFDLPKLNTRFIYWGLDPIPKLRTADTYKIARKEFKFSSNRLDYIAQYLGLSGKMSTSKGLWLEALKGNYDAVQEMLEYNKVDVEINEQVYLKLRPFATIHANLSLMVNDKEDNFGELKCPKCGSNHLQKRGKAYTATQVYQRYQCKGCGGWSRGRRNFASKKETGSPIADKSTVGQ